MSPPDASMQVSFVIPVRLGSSRLPRKALADINGQPLLWHVWSRVCQVKDNREIYVATDSQEVLSVVHAWGGRALMTSEECRSGTDRIASILPHLSGDLIVNVQGDEVLVDPAVLDALVAMWRERPVDLITPVFRITEPQDLLDPNVVKVVRDRNARALYFSRSPVPHVRDTPTERWLQHHAFWGHVGVYGYRREVLSQYPALRESTLEQAERLEQLRFLDAGITIDTMEVPYAPRAVDTPEDLETVRRIFEEAG